MHRHRFTVFFLGIAIVTMVMTGCASNNPRNWGEDVTWAPGWHIVGDAAARAAKNPNTWVPLLGAATFLTFDIDEKVSDWATDHTPVFGSEKRAETYSDNAIYLTTGAYYSTAILNDSGIREGNIGKISWNKARGMVTGFGAFTLDYGVTELLKSAIDRERPDGKSDGSFPSLHASGAAVQATLASRNLEFMPLTRRGRVVFTTGLHILSGSIAWARVEAGHHFPSDVLAGYALGNFIGNFVNDAFVTPYIHGHRVSFAPATQEGDGWMVGWQKTFQ